MEGIAPAPLSTSVLDKANFVLLADSCSFDFMMQLSRCGPPFSLIVQAMRLGFREAYNAISPLY